MTRSDTRKWEGRLLGVGMLLPAVAVMADPLPDTGAAAAAATIAAESAMSEVVVTGTNVRGAELDSVAPIQIVDRAALEEAGASQFSEMLLDIPANSGTALYNESGMLSGTAQFELRGLGFSSTLVLVNGRRAGVAPLSDTSGADFLDINQFPLAMVDRIEVLKDGASAIYGSEAVAGVVNIITRRGFEGLELSGNYKSSSNDSHAVNLAAGAKFGRGLFNLYATYYGQSRNQRSDFDWLMERVGGSGEPGRSQLITANGYPGTYSRGMLDASGNAAGVPGAVRLPDPDCEAAGGVFRINDDGSVNRTVCNANFTDQISVIPAQRRLQAFAELGFDITDRLSFFNETNVSGNLNMLNERPGSFSNGSVVQNTKGYVYVPASHPFNFFTADPANPSRLVHVDPAQWDPAIHQAVPVVGNFRPEGVNTTREKRQQNDYFRSVNGLRFQFGEAWSASLSDSYAYAKFEETDPLGVDARELSDVLLSGDYNPFGTSIVSPDLVSPKDGVSVARNSQDVLDRFFYPAVTVRKTEQQVIDAAVSGPLVSLPTGDVAIAVGGQYRSLSLKVTPDSLSAAGGGTTPASPSAVYGTQDVTAAYVETVIPFEDRAQVQLAVRREDYGGAVGAATDPKIAGRIHVIEGLGLRGSWGTSFQAPTLTQQSVSVARVIVNDPVVLGAGGLTCAPSTVGSTNVSVITSGDNLRPQSSENFNLGLDVRPSPDLSMTADYWHYRYSNLIAAAQNAPSIVSGECRNGQYVPDPRVTRGASGQLNTVNNEYVNVGKVVADGLDFSAVLRQSLGSIGDLRFRADATYIKKFDVYGANGSVSQKAGSRNFTNNFAPMPKVRAGGTVAWNRGIHNAALSANFIDGYRNDQSNNAPISSFTTVDVQYGLSFSGSDGRSVRTFSIGADNVFDKDPPALVRYTSAGEYVTGLSAIDRPAYDPLVGADIRGRVFYARFTNRF